MNYRQFGSTALHVSELGFGSWAIGGQSYGRVERDQALRALARAEEHGCNFVDTAQVYGDSEEILGEFLKGRRDRWIISTKYSGQSLGLEVTLDSQLRRLGIEQVDFYQLHWLPRDNPKLFDELYRMREKGKVRCVGVSLYSSADIDQVLRMSEVDGIQIGFSLLDLEPLLSRLPAIRARRMGVIVRSALKGGFLTGKYGPDSRFLEANDQRREWSPVEIVEIAQAAGRFRFLDEELGSMAVGAIRYPLSFAEVSTVVVSCKSVAQVDINIGKASESGLTPAMLEHIVAEQKKLGLVPGTLKWWGKSLGRLVKTLSTRWR